MKRICFILLAILGMGISMAQTKVAGVTLPQTVNFQNQQLILNGAGVREKLWIDLYAGGLYLTEKSSDANAIISANEGMAIKLHIVSKLISSNKMIEAVDEGFQKSTNGNTKAIDSKIEKFKSFFMDEITKNDVFDIVYIPSSGVTVYKNGTEKGSIDGMDFKKALFGIWLSNNPADDDLKEAMLGK